MSTNPAQGVQHPGDTKMQLQGEVTECNVLAGDGDGSGNGVLSGVPGQSGTEERRLEDEWQQQEGGEYRLQMERAARQVEVNAAMLQGWEERMTRTEVRRPEDEWQRQEGGECMLQMERAARQVEVNAVVLQGWEEQTAVLAREVANSTIESSPEAQRGQRVWLGGRSRRGGGREHSE